MNRMVLFFMLAFSLVPLMWFQEDTIIAGGDSTMLLNPAAVFEAQWLGWNHKVSFGEPSNSAYVVMSSFWKMLEFLPFSLIQKLWFIINYGLIVFIFFMYLRESKLVENENAAAIAAIFYAYNPFTMIDPTTYANVAVLLNIPLFLLFVHKLINCMRFEIKLAYAVLYGIASLTFLPILGNPPTAISWIIIAMLYPLLLIFYFRVPFLAVFQAYVLLGLFFLCFNMKFIVHFLATIQREYYAAKTLSFFPISGSGIMSDFFRLLGSWAFRDNYLGIPYYPYAKLFDSFPLVGITFLVPFCAFLSIIFSRKPDMKKSVFFGVLALIGIFLAKGSLPPFGWVYAFLFNSFEVFLPWREPFTKFTQIVVFSYAVLCAFLLERIKNNLFSIAFVVIVVISAYPLYTGECIRDNDSEGLRSMRVQIPYEYEVVKEVLMKGKSERIFIFPKSEYGEVRYWVRGINTAFPPQRFLFPQEVVYTTDNEKKRGLNFNFLDALYEGIYIYRPKNISALLSFYGVDHIILEKNVGYHKKSWTFEEHEGYLKEVFNESMVFGNVSVYHVGASLSNFLFSTKCYVTNDTMEKRIEFLFSSAFQFDGVLCDRPVEGINNTYVFFSHNNTMEIAIPGVYDVYCQIQKAEGKRKERYESVKIKTIEVITPVVLYIDDKCVAVQNTPKGKVLNVTYVRKNPSEYSFEINEAQKGVIVFMQTFNPYWKINATAEHFIANGFMNGYVVDFSQGNAYRVNYIPEMLGTLSMIFMWIISLCVLAVWWALDLTKTA